MLKETFTSTVPSPFSSGIEFRAAAAHSLRGSEITDILEAVVAEKLGRSHAMLPIASFIIHDLDWPAGNNFDSFAPYSDHPLTGLHPRNAPTGISRP